MSAKDIKKALIEAGYDPKAAIFTADAIYRGELTLSEALSRME